MSTPISEYVTVTITVQDAVVQAAGFGTAAIFDTFVEPASWTAGQRVKAYADLAALALDFVTTTKVHRVAKAMFAGARAPNTVKVLRGDSGDANITAALDAVEAEDSDWYGLVSAYRLEADINEIAAWVSSAGFNHVYGTCSEDVGIPDSGVSIDILSDLQGFAYTRSFLLYSQDGGVDSTSGNTVTVLAAVATVAKTAHGLRVGDLLTVTAADNVNVSAVVNSTLYTVTINGTAVTFTSDASATGLEIRDGLLAAINVHAVVGKLVTAANGATDADLTITSRVEGVTITLAVDANLTLTQLEATLDGNKTVATVPNANSFTYAAAGVADDAVAKAVSYSARYRFPESRWVGNQLPTEPGAEDWGYKRLIGQTPTSTTLLNLTQQRTVRGKGGNVYTDIGGIGVTQLGIMASGRFIDTQIGMDWLEARLEEAIIQRRINVGKLPYTQAGINSLRGDIVGVLQLGQANGLLGPLADSTSGEVWRIVLPQLADISDTNKSTRNLPAIKVTVQLAGSIVTFNIDVTALI